MDCQWEFNYSRFMAHGSNLTRRFRLNILKLLVFAALALVAYGWGYSLGQKHYLERQMSQEAENTLSPDEESGPVTTTIAPKAPIKKTK